MSKIGIFMADGCEEIEGLTVVDVVRRAKMESCFRAVCREPCIYWKMRPSMP